jgi:hypothetical protein
MNDVTALGIFFACLLATLGLLRVCEALLPRDKPRAAGSSALTKEAGQ